MTAVTEPSAPDPMFHGRRRGRRLRPNRAALVETALPRLRVPLPAAPATLDWAALYPRPLRDLWLEIGFGSGEHLAWQAERHPDVALIGAEPFLNGVAALLARIEAAGLDNIRIHPDDARPLLRALPDRCLGRAFVLFADPWPKTRHHRRRFIQPETLDELARLLRPGAELRLASDDPGLVDWTLFQTRRHPKFTWSAETADDWRERPADWPQTRYEAKAVRQGRRPAFLMFRRNDEP